MIGNVESVDEYLERGGVIARARPRTPQPVAGLGYSVEAILVWSEAALPGDRMEYFRGYLAERSDWPAVDALRGEAVKLYLTGFYEMAQLRVARDAFSYLLIRRRKRDDIKRLWFTSAGYSFSKP